MTGIHIETQSASPAVGTEGPLEQGGIRSEIGESAKNGVTFHAIPARSEDNPRPNHRTSERGVPFVPREGYIIDGIKGGDLGESGELNGIQEKKQGGAIDGKKRDDDSGKRNDTECEKNVHDRGKRSEPKGGGRNIMKSNKENGEEEHTIGTTALVSDIETTRLNEMMEIMEQRNKESMRELEVRMRERMQIQLEEMVTKMREEVMENLDREVKKMVAERGKQIANERMEVNKLDAARQLQDLKDKFSVPLNTENKRVEVKVMREVDREIVKKCDGRLKVRETEDDGVKKTLGRKKDTEGTWEEIKKRVNDAKRNRQQNENAGLDGTRTNEEEEQKWGLLSGTATRKSRIGGSCAQEKGGEVRQSNSNSRSGGKQESDSGRNRQQHKVGSRVESSSTDSNKQAAVSSTPTAAPAATATAAPTATAARATKTESVATVARGEMMGERGRKGEDKQREEKKKQPPAVMNKRETGAGGGVERRQQQQKQKWPAVTLEAVRAVSGGGTSRSSISGSRDGGSQEGGSTTSSNSSGASWVTGSSGSGQRQGGCRQEGTKRGGKVPWYNEKGALQKRCYDCGKRGHKAVRCTMVSGSRKMKCYACGGRGHEWHHCRKRAGLWCLYCGRQGEHDVSVCMTKALHKRDLQVREQEARSEQQQQKHQQQQQWEYEEQQQEGRARGGVADGRGGGAHHSRSGGHGDELVYGVSGGGVKMTQWQWDEVSEFQEWAHHQQAVHEQRQAEKRARRPVRGRGEVRDRGW
jgi:hypothetical protein